MHVPDIASDLLLQNHDVIEPPPYPAPGERAETAPITASDGRKKEVVWFALTPERPLCAFAGIWDRMDRYTGHESPGRQKQAHGPGLFYPPRETISLERFFPPPVARFSNQGG
jgi:hypothetical protein